MKQLIFLSLSVLVSVSVHAEDKHLRISYWLEEVVTDSSLLPNESALDIVVDKPSDGCKNGNLRFGYTDFEETLKLNKSCEAQTIVQPGTYQFLFLLTNLHDEIITEPLVMNGGQRVKIHLLFRDEGAMEMVRKPVIYLYPDSVTNVHVEVDPVGEFTFTYPTYNKGWDVEAHPDGSLHLGDESYNYLFWESEQRFTERHPLRTGFAMDADSVTPFLNRTLAKMGLTSQEIADFVTFWAPQMTGGDIFIRFLFNEECDQFAKLKVTPKPDTVFRVYMVWKQGLPAHFLPPQTIPTIDRSGFTVIEWGGLKL